ncbi:hypothetical protein JD79_01823 [Geodermatophilus normandii]|uniref:Uncharacterized protein n=1 Tax=Geodermatophilus normandii TaxID=1137989 RepID=A0A317QKE7_9ACTN|nr:hypothetical protein [Geodermatophilus normandii]PWW22665.1 hypothetical protein JD79_01823 [Geodermatophilus normandii]
MAQPRRDPDPGPGPETGGRPLADILREAGIEAPRSVRRRRGDTGDLPIKQRKREPDTDVEQPNPGRRASDTGRVSETGRFARDTGRVADTGRQARDRGLEEARDTGRVAGAPAGATRGPDGPSTAAIPGIRPSRKPGVPGAAPATGPIPVTRPGETEVLDEPLGAREGALAWLRFAGELVLALAAGVGIYFLATVVWEQLPQVAVVLAPLAVTGLVAGVGAWRQRTGREPTGLRLVAVLVFAGTLLTIAPAAGLLAGT